MKLVRYRDPKTSEPLWGINEEGSVFKLNGDPYQSPAKGDPAGKYEALHLLAPAAPTKIVAAAINYRGATDWQEGMDQPLFFYKPPSSLCGPRDKIVSYFDDAPSWGEVEVAFVIGRRLWRASAKEAEEAIAGYTVADDASAENVMDRDHHLARSKGADSYCPLGPWLDTEFDWRDKEVLGWHGERLVRKGNTKELFWEPARIAHFLSTWMTLEPGDLILTASPPLQGPLTYLEDGDRFTARVEGFPDLITDFHQARPLRPEVKKRWFKEQTQNV